MAIIRTKRWQDPTEEGDGLRVLITRYRPRIASAKETWNEWDRRLAPSKALLARGKSGEVDFAAYAELYAVEMASDVSRAAIAEYAARVRPVTLLCFCTDATKCHRTVAARLIADVARGAA